MLDAAQFDMVIRGGTVYDGDGGPPEVLDVAIDDGRIAALGRVRGRGRREIDATGKLVTPGFVDIHTHYDGQAVWDDQISPSSWHGVTTVVMGNCGVGFAPCRPEDRDALISLMEGVEDIPAPVMHQGLEWQWQSFPEYLDVLEAKPRDIDIAALVPHAPLRVYVMGERALHLEPAMPRDVARMRAIVADAVGAGALGVSTSRTTSHRTRAGRMTPTLLAREREVRGLLDGIAEGGGGFFEVVAEPGEREVLNEYHMLRRCVEATGVPAVFSLAQSHDEPELWRELMEFADGAVADGVPIRPVAAPRAIGMLLGLEGSQNPFSGTASYREIANLPLARRVDRLREADFRRRILNDDPTEFSTFPLMERVSYDAMYRFGDPVNYTPARADSITAIAQAQKRTPKEVAYDLMLDGEGQGFIYVPFANYAGGDLKVCEEMLANPNVVMGLSDGGAHVGFILDAGFPTWLLVYWARERRTMTVAEAVRRLTSDTADAAGLTDRGRLRSGLRADINVIDFQRLGLGSPFVAYDLPGGGKRLLQRATGYEVTIVAGEITYRDGIDTGARPGHLVRRGRA